MVEIGDIAQLSFDGNRYAHTLVITKIDSRNSLDNIYISSHTYDAFNKSIASYSFEKIRFIHIKGSRK